MTLFSVNTIVVHVCGGEVAIFCLSLASEKYHPKYKVVITMVVQSMPLLRT